MHDTAMVKQLLGDIQTEQEEKLSELDAPRPKKGIITDEKENSYKGKQEKEKDDELTMHFEKQNTEVNKNDDHSFSNELAHQDEEISEDDEEDNDDNNFFSSYILS